MLNEAELTQIFSSIKDHHSVVEKAEITLEANPEDVSKEKLILLRQLGVNRLSIGIQSFDDEILRKLNRIHNSYQAAQSLALAHEEGFSNLNADLIFAIPGRDLSILKRDIAELFKYHPSHISAYGLTIEEKTAFGKWKASGKFHPVSEDQNADEFEFLMEELPAKGYNQYEISNYAVSGFESRHNSNYWKGVPYLGIGPGAHSYEGKSRQINVSNNHAYIKSFQNQDTFWTTEILREEDHINEYIMTSLRTREGCNLEYLNQKFRHNLSSDFSSILKNLILSGNAELKNDFLILTKKGKLIADEIASNLFIV